MSVVSKFAISKLINRNSPSHREIDNKLVHDLEELVCKYSIARDMSLYTDNNAKTAVNIHKDTSNYCDFVYYDTKHNNVVFGWGEPSLENKIVIGGHYDGPGHSPGADDNASAIAVLIKLAESLQHERPEDVVLVAFNGEEYGMLGSTKMVERINYCKAAVILEMVGYFTDEPNSQNVPDGFPADELSVGDFLAIIGNQHSTSLGRSLLKASNNSDLPAIELKVPMGLEEVMPGLRHLCRSDHYPFWKKKFPAIMLTDTAEFRNKNYHEMSDLPNTLNYKSMSRVVEILHDWVTTRTDFK